MLIFVYLRRNIAGYSPVNGIIEYCEYVRISNIVRSNSPVNTSTAVL